MATDYASMKGKPAKSVAAGTKASSTTNIRNPAGSRKADAKFSSSSASVGLQSISSSNVHTKRKKTTINSSKSTTSNGAHQNKNHNANLKNNQSRPRKLINGSRKGPPLSSKSILDYRKTRRRGDAPDFNSARTAAISAAAEERRRWCLFWIVCLYLVSQMDRFLIHLPEEVTSSLPVELSFLINNETEEQPQQQQNCVPSEEAEGAPPAFRLLCTSSVTVMEWGSFKLRCHDLRAYIKTLTTRVEVDVTTLRLATGAYNATMIIKDLLHPNVIAAVTARNISLGKLFVDVVDYYDLNATTVPPEYEVIVQNEEQAKVYPNHTTHVVTHWYNSWAGDDHMEPFLIRDVYTIELKKTLRLATVWSPQPFQAGCVDLSSVPGVRYECIEERFNIADWYHKYMLLMPWTASAILHDPKRGVGYMYWKLFRKYDVLVVYAKRGLKLDFGNVQRAVSQMRSNVPVLVERRGKAHGLFLDHYNYSCSFSRTNLPMVVERMKSIEVRKQCQKEAQRIVEDYTPEAIVKEFLKAFRYNLTESEKPCRRRGFIF